jgi:hypothetical protein
MRRSILATLVLFCIATSVDAATLAISLGVRETGSSGPIFGDGGTANGIEWVNLDGQSLTTDGTWQLFTFTPAVDALSAFAGATANGILDQDWGTIEHIRIRNIDGITVPIRMWIDDVTNTDSAGAVVEGFESFTVGDEVMFQEPNFSGSTSSNLVAGGTAAVSDSMAFAGSQSYETNFQFVDNTNTRWVRLTTFLTSQPLPNPRVHMREPGAPNPTISFYAKAIVIPEPATIALVGLGLLGLVMGARRRSV